ncbi:hypothetical protein HOD08_02655, partial [bacterium]|nr:hypothetical protein [bacterium]
MKFISISTFVILLSSVTSPCYAEEPDFSKIFENIDFGAIEQMIENNPALKKMADNIDKAIEDDDDEALENAFKGIPPMAMPDEKATESLAEQKQQREEKEKEIAEREKRKLESRGHMLKITEDIIGPLNATVRLISPIRMGGELGDRLSKACHKLNKVQSIVEQMLDNEIYVDEFFAKKINEKFSAERITKLNRRLTAETGTTLDEDEATANEAEDKFI